MNKSVPVVRQLLDRHFQHAELAAVIGTNDEQSLRLARTATGAPLEEMLGRPGKELRARFVEHAFAIAVEACGHNDARLPAELPYAVELLHCGSLIVDDVQDDAQVRRGGAAMHRMVGVPLAINAGNFLYFLPLRLLSQLDLAPMTRLAMLDRITNGLIRCHHGQGLDLAYRVGDMAQRDVTAVVELSTTLKTGALMELSCALGALAAGASPSVEAALADFGREAGLALQMLDDLGGFFVAARKNKAAEDLVAQRPTWAWAWIAQSVDDASFASLQTKLADAGTSEACLDSLIDAMRSRLAGVRQRPRQRLDRAFAALGASVGDCLALEPLLRDVRVLEQGYV